MQTSRHGRPGGRWLRPVLLCGWWLAVGSAAVAAEPAHLALVIGEAAYTGWPALPGCFASAHEVAEVLSRAGFAVTERHDLSNGETDGAIAEFTARLAGPPAGTGVIYVCGYAAGYAGRSFVLPVSARLERETDVLTQGMLATSLASGMARAGATAGLVLLDLVAAPSASAAPASPLGLDALAGGGSAPGIGLVAALEAGAQGQTPLSQTLSAAIVPPTVETAAVIGGIEQALAATAGLKLWVHLPPEPSFLAGGPVAAPPPPPPPPVVAVAPPPAAPAPVAAPAAESPPPPLVASPPEPPGAAANAAPTPPASAPLLPPLPDEEHMTDADRRLLQRALVTLGYYAGPVDGLFGPDTRAAIRRFQHEIGVGMTGRLSGQQARQLLARGG